MTVDSFWEVNSFYLKECIFGRTETCEVKPSLCQEDEQRHVNAIPANNVTITFHKLRDTGRFYANVSWTPPPGKFIRISRICNVQFPSIGSFTLYLRLIKGIIWNNFTIYFQKLWKPFDRAVSNHNKVQDTRANLKNHKLSEMPLLFAVYFPHALLAISSQHQNVS